MIYFQNQKEEKETNTAKMQASMPTDAELKKNKLQIKQIKSKLTYIVS